MRTLDLLILQCTNERETKGTNQASLWMDATSLGLIHENTKIRRWIVILKTIEGWIKPDHTHDYLKAPHVQNQEDPTLGCATWEVISRRTRAERKRRPRAKPMT